MSHLSSDLHIDQSSTELSSLLRQREGVYYASVRLGASVQPLWVALHGITSEPMALRACEAFTRMGHLPASVDLKAA